MAKAAKVTDVMNEAIRRAAERGFLILRDVGERIPETPGNPSTTQSSYEALRQVKNLMQRKGTNG